MKKIVSIIAFAALFAGCQNKVEQISLTDDAVLKLSSETIDGKIILLEPKTRTIDIRVEAEKMSDEPLLVDIAADESLVESYNQEHGTTYRMPPSGAYSISGDNLLLPRFNTLSSTGTVSLISSGLLDTDEYLLPVTISDIDGSVKVKKADVGSVIYIVYGKRQLPPAQNMPKADWKLLYNNSYSVGNYHTKHGFVRSDGTTGEDAYLTGYPEDIIDGDYASIWGYNYNKKDTPPYYFVIDFGKEITVRGLTLWAQRGNNDMMNPDNTTPTSQCGLCTVEFATSITDDGMGDKSGGASDWFYSEEFNSADLKNQISNTVYLTEIIRARYMRFAYRGRYASATATSVSTNAGGNLAEIDVLGNEEVLELD